MGTPRLQQNKKPPQLSSREISTPKRKEKQAADGGENKKASKVQTVINRCITVKRKSSPLKNTSNTKRANTSNASQEASNSLDRFAALSEEEPMGKTSTEGNNAKPPPIYLRVWRTKELIKNKGLIIGIYNFHIVPFK